MRTKDIDGDYRHEPKTDRFCVRCQKDIKPNAPTRTVHLLDGHMILHPQDEHLYESDARDTGHFIVGMDCARTIGLEWTT